MDTKRTISISEARKHIFEIADEVQAPNKVYTLTADGKPRAVIMSALEYETLLETLDVMRECPDIFDRIEESRKAIKNKNWKAFVTLEQLRVNLGFAVAEKTKKVYGVSRNRTKKGRKTIR